MSVMLKFRIVSKRKMFLQKISGDKERLLYEIQKIGADPYAMKMWMKGVDFNIKLKSLPPGQANILKQEALASGIDVAVSKNTVSCRVESTDALILSNVSGLKRLVKRLEKQPLGLSKIGEEIQKIIGEELPKRLKVADLDFDLSKPIIMGILNLTPDSFSDGGLYDSVEKISHRMDEIKLYADIVDIGGESTRPGAMEICAEEEISRIKPGLEMALEKGVPISVDTTKSSVAEFALKNGAKMINDISGLTFDSKMSDLIGDYGAGVCIMHTKDRPAVMQNDTTYKNFLEEVKYALYTSIEKALKSGIKRECIVIDPGIGFGKSVSQNYLLIKYLNEFKSLGFPLMIGLSRKSLIGKVDNSPVGERDLVSKVLEGLSIINGANIVRTHDVKSLKKILPVLTYYKTDTLL